MIRSTTHSLKFANKNKLENINQFITQYKNMVNKFINILWSDYQQNVKIPQLLDNDFCQSIKTETTKDSRIRQCAAKQASSMIRAVFEKQNKRLFKLKQLQKENKNTNFLQRKISLFKPTKPNANKISVELDSRFIDIKDGNHFDLFVKVNQIGNKRTIKIPIKHTKVSRKWIKQGEIKTSIRLNSKSITLYFDVKSKEKQGNVTLSADQGLLTCLTLSDGQITKADKDGWDLNKITQKLSRKKKGSRHFRKAQTHRKNYINWSINQLNFDDVKQVKLEKVKNIRKGKCSSRKLSHWCYPLIKNKLMSLSEIKGFNLVENENRFMSQRCSKCGWVHKSSRKGKTFKCANTGCDFVADSDLNAASNHEIELRPLSDEEWRLRKNRSGFYWDEIVIGNEPIVRFT